MTSPYLDQPLRSEESAREQRHISMMECIRRAARAERGMSDEDLARERGAQGRFFRALHEMTAAIREVNDNCTSVQINFEAWEAFVHDELPTERFWEEKISAARNP